MSGTSRRVFLQMAATAAMAAPAMRGKGKAVRLFDGKTLKGWTQIENAATTLPFRDITDPAGFTAKIARGTDAVSVYLRGRLTEGALKGAEGFAAGANGRDVLSALAKELNQILAGPSIYEAARFHDVQLRKETAALLKKGPSGLRAVELNKRLLEDAYPAELRKGSGPGWIVKNGAMASTGSGRGVIYTDKDYARYRLMFTMRHVSGDPDHRACVLMFGLRPKAGEMPLDALGAIQMQPPYGGRWDYRPGRNNDGGTLFTRLVRPTFDEHAWSRVEIVADAAKGTARMAVAQPLGSKAVEVLRFEDATAGRVGPIAWQMHNAGLFDEFKDVTVEENPVGEGLVTVG